MKLHQSISLDEIPGREVWCLVEKFDLEDNCSAMGSRKKKEWFGECIGGPVANKTWRIKNTINNKVTIWRLQ